SPPTGSGLTQAEKLGSVGRADGNAKDGTVDGDPVCERSPEAAGVEAESAFYREAHVVGRPLEKGLCRRGFGDGQPGPRAHCVGQIVELTGLAAAIDVRRDDAEAIKTSADLFVARIKIERHRLPVQRYDDTAGSAVIVRMVVQRPVTRLTVRINVGRS